MKLNLNKVLRSLIFTALFGLFWSPNLRAQGCSGLGSLTLNVVASPAPTLSAPAQLCEEAQGTVAVNGSFSSYAWNTGDTGPSININSGGTYTVTVTNTAGCSATASANITNLPEATPSITQNNYACNGSLTLNAGAFSSYTWSNGGGNGQTATYLSSGTYTVTVTNADGCTGTDNFTIDIPVPPVTSITGDLTFCTGLSTNLSASAGFSNYSWSNGDNSITASISAGGTYTVTVTDAFGCTDTESVSVIANQSPAPIASDGELCIGSSVNIAITNPPFQSYLWSNGSTTSNTTVFVPDLYTVTVTAANGCTGETSANVTPFPTPDPVIVQAAYTCNGQISLSVGAGFSTYDWSNGGSNPNITVNNSGTYTVTVSNNFGCTGTSQFDVDIPSPPVVSIAGDNSFCTGLSANLNATSGLFAYNWSNGDAGESISVNASGTYTVTATDAFGCTATNNFAITELPAPQPVVNGILTICDGTSTVFNTTGNFSFYDWSNGLSSASITVTAAGTYTVTVTATNGCTGTDSEELSVSPTPSPNVFQSAYACDNQLTINTDGGFSTYLWSTGNTGTSIVVDASGDYSVTVTNVQGCTGTGAINVEVPQPLVVEILGENSICPGESSTLSTSLGYTQYIWSNSSPDPQISVSTAGNYTVTVTDNFGCTATNEFGVSQLSAPSPNISGPSQICASGLATFSVPGTYTAYLWNTGETTSSINTNIAGEFTVTVTGTNGCTGSDAQTLTVSTSLIPQIITLPYNCNGQITLDAGTGYSTYTWGGGETTQNITVTVNGDYTVSVSDASGCTGSAVITATLPTPPAVSIAGSNNLCSGASTLLSASTGLSAYVWSDGQVGESITVSTAGLYTVTATDAFGCTATNNFAITELPSPQPVVNGILTICDGASTVFNTTGNFSFYDWSNGLSSASITVTTAGTYTVTVTATNGCTGTDSEELSVTPTPSPNVFQSAYACDNQLTINTDGGFSTYFWSTGNTGTSIVVDASGDYSVTVTNVQGCTGTGAINVEVPQPLVVEILGENSICPGESSTLSTSLGYAQYIWSNSSPDPQISVSTAGNYTVTVTDNFGCTATNEFGVSQLATPNPNISGPTQICASGLATFSVPGTYTNYLWNTGETTSSINTNIAGEFTVTVTDSNGCTGSDAQTLTVSTSLIPQIIASPYNCNGQITLDAGTGYNTYLWGGGETTQNITVTVNGDYTVNVSDVSGCTGSAVITATLPTPPAVSIAGSNNICTGASTLLSASTGLSAYVWSDGQVGESITVSTAGTYTVTATDAIGCTATNTFQLSNPAPPQPIITGPTILCAGNSGTLALGNTFSQYLWSSGETSNSISIATGNTYTVTVTDAFGCTATDNQVVTEVLSLNPVVSALPYACNGLQTLEAGSGFASYLWSSGESTSSVVVNLAGTYSVTVTDASGCTGTSDLTVSIPALPQALISGNTSFCQNTNTTLTANSGFATYLWNTGDTTNTLITNLAGTFTVTVTDNLGCTDTENIVVTALALPLPQISGPTAICANNSATFSLNQPFSSYLWTNGATDASITVNTSGSFAVTVTDANGCTGTANTSLTLNLNPTASIVTEAYACDGLITLSVSAGFTSYSWEGPSGFVNNTPQPAVSQSGTYTVTITDLNGCTASAVQNTSVPVQTQVSLSGPTQVCVGELATLTASIGFASYSWSDGSNGAELSTSNAGIYTVTATDLLGCSSTATVSLGNFPTPTPAIAGPQSVCPGLNATLSVSGGFTAFNWSTSETGSSITVTPPFAGSVTVTDANGCTGTASTSVTVSNQISPNIVSLPYACDGQITLDAGLGFPNYSWSNAGGTPVITVTQSGTYTVTVSDGNSCSGTASIQVTVPGLTSVSVTGVSQICLGQSAELTASSGFVSYNWSNGQTSSILTTDQINTYSVTATDGNGCSSTASFVLSAAPPLAPVLDGNTSICPGNTTVFSVLGNYATYNWSNGANTNSISVSTPGNYAITVTDINGCTGTAAIDLNLNSTPTPSISGANLFCPGSSTTLSANPGFDTYSWSNGSNTPSINTQIAGNYTVTVTNTDGCTGTAAVQIVAAPPATVSITGGGILCGGGSATLSATSSAGAFLWSNGASSNTIGVTESGSYAVTVSDLNGCTAVDAELVDIGSPIVTNLNNTTCRVQDVGNQSFTFSAFNGCDSVVNIVTTYQPSVPGLLDLDTEIEANQDELISLNVAGDFSIDSVAYVSPFNLSCSDCLNPSFTATESGFIQITAFDEGGCASTEEIKVSVKEALGIFTPTVIKPGAAENGFFSVFSAASITSVQNFNVFDRWGNGLFSRSDMPTNDPEAGWDGTFRGQPMQPGVYVYYFEVNLPDGSVEIYSGDVTIVQ